MGEDTRKPTMSDIREMQHHFKYRQSLVELMLSIDKMCGIAFLCVLQVVRRCVCAQMKIQCLIAFSAFAISSIVLIASIMGVVAVLHTESLQLDCKDTKHVTEKDVYNHLPSNEERILGEESSQSTDHQKINNLRERGYMEYGCQHYRRRCRIRAPCCNEIFSCRHCHNEAKNNIDIDQKHRHDIPRHQVKQVICSLCETEQEVQQNCINCGVCMGKYFCGTCKLFDDDVSKKQYHCSGCGICRTGGCENVFHCYRCGCCYPTQMKNSHPCVEGAMHHDCPICFEYLFESVNDVLVLPCGHTIHKSCLNEMREHFQYACPLCSKSVCDMSMIWEKFDMEIAATPMPEAYRNKMRAVADLPIHLGVQLRVYKYTSPFDLSSLTFDLSSVNLGS
ncbi:hypothetical protein DEO72_LG11g3192 [Vigna unguiculata]|uniref:RING finger and CHY zinc finger domain-containing protein 1 n=1 Tax=Vigna unguiculata TaxID=3917 RepID=A0A4D6NUK4_VIGUN|nr:hypothetical protein DEO72_LG11g3192 [Vigna unguiculata]